MIGRVVSAKLQKTATVIVSRLAMHTLYKKTFIRSKKYLVDDPIGVKEGDMVELVKVRPISRNKHFRIVKVVGKNLAEITEEKLKAVAEKTIAEVMSEEKIEEPKSLEESKKSEVHEKEGGSKEVKSQKSKVKSSSKE